MNFFEGVIVVVLFIVILGIISVAVGGLLLLTWNNVIPSFWADAPTLSLWQCVLIMAVLGLIFRGISSGCSSSKGS